MPWEGAGGATDTDAIHDNVAAEISAIAEKVTPVDADLVIIEDSAAANVKKKVQVGNLPGGGGGFHSLAAQQTLTNETPGGTGAYEQWGTEELSFGDRDGLTVQVEAHLYGYISVINVDGATFDTKLQVSFDGGSTWSDSVSTTYTVTVGNNRMRAMVHAGAVLGAAATGDVEVRGMVQASVLTNSPTWANGVIVAVLRIS